jgi:hypothetical protein
MYRANKARTTTSDGSDVTVRLSEASDARALLNLAALDSAAVPSRPTLLAVRDGETVAAVPVSGGRAIADPFRRTAAIVELLELRAAQLRGEGRPRTSSARARLRNLMRKPHALSLR